MTSAVASRSSFVPLWKNDGKLKGVAVSCCSNFCQHFCFHSMSWPDSRPTFCTISISKRKLAASQFSTPQKTHNHHSHRFSFWIWFWIEKRCLEGGGGPLTIVSENRRQISFTMKFKILSIFSQLQLEDGRDCDLWLPSFSVKFIFHSPLQV